MKKGMTLVISIMILALAFGSAFAGREKSIRKEFDGLEGVELNTVSGDCVVKTHSSSEIIVELWYDVEPEDAFEYKFEERRNKLIIKEHWHGRRSSGEVLWTITLPEGAEMEFSAASGDIKASGPLGSFEASTASGDIDVTGVDGDVEISTASGDITIIDADGEKKVSTASGDIHIEDSSDDLDMSTASGDIEVVGVNGDLEFSTASGEIEVSECRGTFDLSCASGEITVHDVVIEGASEFSTASGSVKVVLSETCGYDLELATASGDVTLDYNGNDVKGYFEFEAKKRGGRIVSPFDFDDEEEYERYDQKYVRKWFTRGSDSPKIYLSTASGKVVLKK